MCGYMLLWWPASFQSDCRTTIEELTREPFDLLLLVSLSGVFCSDFFGAYLRELPWLFTQPRFAHGIHTFSLSLPSLRLAAEDWSVNCFLSLPVDRM